MTRKKTNKNALRTACVGVGFIIWLTVIGVRSGYLQLYRGAWLSSKAAVQYEQEVTLRGKRGTIYDASNQAMAVSIETTSVAAHPDSLGDRSKAAAALAKALNLSRQAVLKKLTSKRSFVWIKRQATPKEAAAVRKLNIKGVEFLSEHSRFYPNTTLASQVLGFTGIDGHGLEGLEFFYDRELEGGHSTVTVLKDALGRGFEADAWSGLQQTGNNLVLTLDSHIQFITEQALADAVIRFKGHSGLAIVMAPQTGAVLAMAHYPFFNPNNFREYDRQAWRNRAITDPFEPGSTMKIFSAASALESGASKPNTIFYCENGRYLLGRHTINDTKPYGWLSLQQIVKYSSNIGAVKIVQKLGPDSLYRHLRAFGFGQRTRIDCPGESPGSLANYQRWTVVDTGAIAFGQGISATALQLVTAAAALANDGVMMAPHILQAVTDSNGRPLLTTEPRVARQVISAATASTMRRIMRTVVTEGGTGVQADLEGYTVCGKTGTAQKIDRNGTYSTDRFVSSFIGFAPCERPALVVLVVVDEPREATYGGLVAAPAFKQIAKETLSYLNISPSKRFKKLRVSRGNRGSG